VAMVTGKNKERTRMRDLFGCFSTQQINEEAGGKVRKRQRLATVTDSRFITKFLIDVTI